MTLRRCIAALAAMLVVPVGLLAFVSSPASAATTTVCNGDSWGFGWFKTNTHIDSNRCARVLVVDLTSWYDIPLFSTPIDICANQSGGPPIPTGEWSIVGQTIDNRICGPDNSVYHVQRVHLGTPIISSPGGVVSFAGDGGFHAGTTVAIYGVDFYPGDRVTVVPQGGGGAAASIVWDNVDLRGQVNAQLPSLPLGPANLYVTNQANITSAPYPLFIT
ncbi:MAG TPA: hypothetical protein VJT31_16860 [Rugosimonospora sp.]|nr:hypothetical protein [Rugosimonospora sp.]